MQISIHRQDAKNAKESAKQNSFQAAKNFYLTSTKRPSRKRLRVIREIRGSFFSARLLVAFGSEILLRPAAADVRQTSQGRES